MLKGDTVRLQCHFKSFDGTSVSPNDVRLTIYKTDQTQVEQFILDDTNKLDVGVYFYDYTPASELSEFIFEFAGMVNNHSILARDKIEITFI